MRVLVVVETWGLIGGTERYAGEVVSALAERGHSLRVLCAQDQDPPFAAPAARVERWVEPALAGHGGARGLASLTAALRRARPEAVYALTARDAPAFARLLDEAPVVRFVQDHTLFCPGLNKLHQDGTPCRTALGAVCLERFFLSEGCSGFKRGAFPGAPLRPFRLLRAKLAEIELHQRVAHLVTSSRYMRAELVRAGFAPDRVGLLPYFTAAERSAARAGPAAALPEELRDFASGEPPLVLVPARLTLPDKGVDFLLTALARVGRPFRAVVAGSGPAEEWLRRKARDEGLGERVRFTGWLDPAPLEALYRRCRLVVCPSVWDEPFGLVGLEAMAHRRPVVAFDVGGVRDWLEDGVTGLLAPRRDADRLARAIEDLLADPARCDAFGSAGRARLEREFSRERHLATLERLLAEAADRPAPAG